MHDPTEAARRKRFAEINSEPKDRAALEAIYGRVWDTTELAEFVIIGFMAPFIVVIRKSDGVKGSLEFQHGPPRLYFNFVAD